MGAVEGTHAEMDYAYLLRFSVIGETTNGRRRRR
jgi:hypothetical protein